MAFDEELAARIRSALARKRGIEEKKMFGGVGFLLHGNMLVGVWKTSMIVRLGPDEAELAMFEPHVGPFDITGKAMKGWAMVGAPGVVDVASVRSWIDRALAFTGKLPRK
jgi:hypothetical protein